MAHTLTPTNCNDYLTYTLGSADTNYLHDWWNGDTLDVTLKYGVNCCFNLSSSLPNRYPFSIALTDCATEDDAVYSLELTLSGIDLSRITSITAGSFNNVDSVTQGATRLIWNVVAQQFDSSFVFTIVDTSGNTYTVTCYIQNMDKCQDYGIQTEVVYPDLPCGLAYAYSTPTNPNGELYLNYTAFYDSSCTDCSFTQTCDDGGVAYESNMLVSVTSSTSILVDTVPVWQITVRHKIMSLYIDYPSIVDTFSISGFVEYSRATTVVGGFDMVDITYRSLTNPSPTGTLKISTLFENTIDNTYFGSNEISSTTAGTYPSNPVITVTSNTFSAGVVVLPITIECQSVSLDADCPELPDGVYSLNIDDNITVCTFIDCDFKCMVMDKYMDCIDTNPSILRYYHALSTANDLLVSGSTSCISCTELCTLYKAVLYQLTLDCPSKPCGCIDMTNIGNWKGTANCSTCS